MVSLLAAMHSAAAMTSDGLTATALAASSQGRDGADQADLAVLVAQVRFQEFTLSIAGS
jgi:hypothetical protein